MYVCQASIENVFAAGPVYLHCSLSLKSIGRDAIVVRQRRSATYRRTRLLSTMQISVVQIYDKPEGTLRCVMLNAPNSSQKTV